MPIESMTESRSKFDATRTQHPTTMLFNVFGSGYLPDLLIRCAPRYWFLRQSTIFYHSEILKRAILMPSCRTKDARPILDLDPDTCPPYAVDLVLKHLQVGHYNGDSLRAHVDVCRVAQAFGLHQLAQIAFEKFVFMESPRGSLYTRKDFPATVKYVYSLGMKQYSNEYNFRAYLVNDAIRNLRRFDVSMAEWESVADTVRPETWLMEFRGDLEREAGSQSLPQWFMSLGTGWPAKLIDYKSSDGSSVEDKKADAPERSKTLK